jgi:hypothetical protein
MHSRTILAGALALAPYALAYSLVDDYTGNDYADFFNKFSFWNTNSQADPTRGFVQYASQSDAWNKGLIGNGGNIYMGVNDPTYNPGNGRAVVRLTSNKSYTSGTLVAADIAHMVNSPSHPPPPPKKKHQTNRNKQPDGICGTWSAFWMTSSTPKWPTEGEIDIIEQANNANSIQMSLHVSNQQGKCNIATSVSMKAKRDRWNDCTHEGQGGCDANDPLKHSFGSVFNQDNGGVYAMEWANNRIKTFFFPRDGIPSGDSGPLGNHPHPSTWGTPTTDFGRSCDLQAHVKNQRIVINTDFCGDWAGDDWSRSGCAASTGESTCKAYVQKNPSAFTNAFWTFKSLQVFQ